MSEDKKDYSFLDPPPYYLEYDDGHNYPMVYRFMSFEEALDHVVGRRPTMEKGRYGMGPYKDTPGGTAAERLARDQEDWDIDHDLLLEVVHEHSEASISCNTWRWVDADTMEARAEAARITAEKMRRGEQP